MDAVVIINPVAGGRRSLPADRRVAAARRALGRAGAAGDVVLTDRAGHGREIARAAVESGCRTVIAWGGDGTVNEVASALVNTPAALGIVRAGSGNGLARELGVSTRPDAALDAALTGRDAVLDAGLLDGRLFLNVAGIGFDAAMAAAFNGLGTERRGAWRYTGSVVRSVFSYRPVEYVVEIDGERLESTALLVAVANLPQYGANAVIAPAAVPFDGLLDVVIVGARGALGRIGLVPRLFDRSIHKAAGITCRTGRRIVVSAASPMAFHVDGEPLTGGTSLEAVVLSRALRVRGARPRRWRGFFDASTAGILDP